MLPPLPGFGAAVGLCIGASVGAAVGMPVGAGVEASVGAAVGTAVGTFVGAAVGTFVGAAVGAAVGTAVGISVGIAVGTLVGAAVGISVGAAVGAFDGTDEGIKADGPATLSRYLYSPGPSFAHPLSDRTMTRQHAVSAMNRFMRLLLSISADWHFFTRIIRNARRNDLGSVKFHDFDDKFFIPFH